MENKKIIVAIGIFVIIVLLFTFMKSPGMKITGMATSEEELKGINRENTDYRIYITPVLKQEINHSLWNLYETSIKSVERYANNNPNSPFDEVKIRQEAIEALDDIENSMPGVKAYAMHNNKFINVNEDNWTKYCESEEDYTYSQGEMVLGWVKFCVVDKRNKIFFLDENPYMTIKFAYDFGKTGKIPPQKPKPPKPRSP